MEPNSGESELDLESDKEIYTLLEKIWAENGDAQLSMKSIWTMNADDEMKAPGSGKLVNRSNKYKETGSVTVPAITQEIARGGRLQLDETYNQMEELETERRSNEACYGIVSIPFCPTIKGQFDFQGLSTMLFQIRRQFELLKYFIVTLEGKRVDAETKAISLSPLDQKAMIFELCCNNKEKANAIREGFNIFLKEFYDDWESHMNAFQRVLCPQHTSVGYSTVRLDVMPYHLKELGDIVRFSRTTLFCVCKRYDEVLRRVHRAENIEQELDPSIFNATPLLNQ